MKVYTYNNKVLTNSANGKWLKKAVNPYNPLDLPDRTIRVKLYIPAATFAANEGGGYYAASVLNVTPVSEDACDITPINQSTTDLSTFRSLSAGYSKEILGGNLNGFTSGYMQFNDLIDVHSLYIPWWAGGSSIQAIIGSMMSVKHIGPVGPVTNMQQMYSNLTALETVEMGNTSNVTNIMAMFNGCSSLKAIPDFDVSSVTDCGATFTNCKKVESGALNMYQKLSALSPLPTYNRGTFLDCGSDTVTGAAELAQIPSSWGGTGA